MEGGYIGRPLTRRFLLGQAGMAAMLDLSYPFGGEVRYDRPYRRVGTRGRR
jgi:hypothetical protein